MTTDYAIQAGAAAFVGTFVGVYVGQFLSEVITVCLMGRQRRQADRRYWESVA